MNEKKAAPRHEAGPPFVDCARGTCGYPLFPCGRAAVKSAALRAGAGQAPPRAAPFLSCDGLYPPAIRATEEVLTHGRKGEGRFRQGDAGRTGRASGTDARAGTARRYPRRSAGKAGPRPERQGGRRGPETGRAGRRKGRGAGSAARPQQTDQEPAAQAAGQKTVRQAAGSHRGYAARRPGRTAGRTGRKQPAGGVPAAEKGSGHRGIHLYVGRGAGRAGG